MTQAQASRDRSGAKVQRCPACGHRFQPPAPAECELCGYVFAGPPTTGMDATPYSHAYSEGGRGWWAMLKWVYGARGERIRHLALMRASSASRRFCMFNLLWLAAALAVFHVSQTGWHEANAGLAARGGAGWLRVAAAETSGDFSAAAPRALWWNARMAAVAFVVSFVAAIFAAWLALAVVRIAVESLHTQAYRGEGRLTAALHYATAWLAPASFGGLLMLPHPLARASEVARWRVALPDEAVLTAAGVAASIGVVLGWLFLLRLGTTVPVRCRSRIVAFFALGVPLLLGMLAMLWHLGLMTLYTEVAERLHWSFQA